MKLINKLLTMKVEGKGEKGDFFGRINKKVCFISLKDGEKVAFDQVVDIKVIHETEKVAFAELINTKDSRDTEDFGE